MSLTPKSPMTDAEAKRQCEMREAEAKLYEAKTALARLKMRHIHERSVEESNRKLEAQRAKVKEDIRRKQHQAEIRRRKMQLEDDEKTEKEGARGLKKQGQDKLELDAHWMV
jgi:hypothetical protein